MLKPHIVILGAGFGGTYVAKKLAKHVKKGRIEITIINRTNYFLFTPLLHEVATGSLTPTSIAEPLREIFVDSGIRIVQGIVESINRSAKTVKISNQGSLSTISYDYLVIATGAETNYYDILGAEKFTYPLKNLSDAARIRSVIVDSLERAFLTLDKDERVRLLSFIVVGGGATGVETAAELAGFIQEIIGRYYSQTKDCDLNDYRICKPQESSVTLIHAGPELLQTFGPSLRAAAEKRLRDNNIIVRLNSTVSEVTGRGIKLSSGISVASATIIWTAGVKPVIPHFEGDMPTLTTGRLAVDEYFRVNHDSCVFALGDAAGYVNRDILNKDPTKTLTLPLLAQVAEGQAKILARNVISSIRGKKLVEFHYHSKGNMVSVGQRFAVGEIFSLFLSGRLTWWLWRTIYLFKFASWKKRVHIVFEWTLNIFFQRDMTKLT
ncbi:MAG: hypothetical protein A3C79_02360 [Candidatus Taylorbacteria bacterium RIFCSPHIGHO2_02_FULL_45_28]|uniref:NADH:ubiquinone reductase (non-electrogenic) n=1 Tax=Candidatus Taylorbacteria bacterium RIFCSPHIGHO2_12_FULL_45_16 TaxID=1802315 RepID=A0A1G2MXM5_9BACT|nr:MAG: hypothetical protein A2830_03170 [Candidatus Taylorbacteria bacterium RIFCSPHIGHO2_01_FULL_44_110]OHA25298.1 MAG: hypothetical protein A3C79_02360 [Candidatus Taylorbacteria bacterium RIFCSPHIGHO2_02_FULL_45_28]OHA28685.1 MAG: hypothetical protein A3F51_02830 [Candidatus Taylorbacteria bacterium RIFCSPHIGHO2_12_FULL_45_16]OHA32958.1 MAG: hypothetical protein A3A23_01005 [Candidatus Taylorbacteria bacterium RIFCSPLOWO2_01_FULL_45_59]OHA38447.1 MAG: hypothetical protein A3I98_00505 [Candi